MSFYYEFMYEEWGPVISPVTHPMKCVNLRSFLEIPPYSFRVDSFLKKLFWGRDIVVEFNRQYTSLQNERTLKTVLTQSFIMLPCLPHWIVNVCWSLPHWFYFISFCLFDFWTSDTEEWVNFFSWVLLHLSLMISSVVRESFSTAPYK